MLKVMNFTKTALRWYKKACNDDDSFDQFISIWISFNAIYGSNNNGSEINKIKTVVRQFSNQQICTILSKDSISFFCNINPSIKYLSYDELKDTSEWQRSLVSNLNYNPREALIKLLLILNKVRNNLFHGGKLLDRSRDVDIVTNAYPVIKTIVEEYLQIELSHEINEYNTELNSNNNISIIKKINDLQSDLESLSEFLINYSAIEKNREHPVSILMGHYFIWDYINWGEEIKPSTLKEYQELRIKEYSTNKPQVLRDLDEAYEFITYRINQVIDNGCTKEELISLREEYINLQKKFIDQGYDIHK